LGSAIEGHFVFLWPNVLFMCERGYDFGMVGRSRVSNQRGSTRGPVQSISRWVTDMLEMDHEQQHWYEVVGKSSFVTKALQTCKMVGRAWQISMIGPLCLPQSHLLCGVYCTRPVLTS